MATPHVSAVAALVWSANPSWTNTQIRQALSATAQDAGAAGGMCIMAMGWCRPRPLWFTWVGARRSTIRRASSLPTREQFCRFALNTFITFTASASDTEDGNLSAAVVWTEGTTPLGTGTSLTTKSDLAVGTHVIRQR